MASTAFGFASTAEEVSEGIDLTGKTYLVTGVNSGLGHETARVLALRGARVFGTARSLEKAKTALDAIAPDHSAPFACELSEPASVRAAVEGVRGELGKLGAKLDGIICNAGIMALPELQEKHGIELQFLTNHIGHFILVTGLLDQLADDGRVVIVSSGAHRNAPEEGVVLDDLSGNYAPWRQYGQSKMANILFARALTKRFEGTQKVANALHPGVIKTNLARHLPGQGEPLFESMGADALKSIPQGAATQMLLAVHPSTADVSGAYFSDCQPSTTTPPGQDDALAEALWKKTEELIAAL